MITLDALELPEGLLWTDELSDQKIRQSIRHSLGGRQFIQSQALIINRAITLSGSSNNGWMTRTLLLQLKVLADSNSTHTLTLHDGSVFDVRWNYEAIEIAADLIKLKHDPDLSDFYQNVVLRFIQV